jgi:hypothetical protein
MSKAIRAAVGVIVLATGMPAQAQDKCTTPKLNGGYKCMVFCGCQPRYRDPQITQSGKALGFVNECGMQAGGSVNDDCTSFTSDWGGGNIEENATAIRFSNGTVWRKQ